jgi:hypothetical protein
MTAARRGYPRGHWSASAITLKGVRSPFPGGYGELPLLKVFNGAILASQRRNPTNVGRNRRAPVNVGREG